MEKHHIFLRLTVYSSSRGKTASLYFPQRKIFLIELDKNIIARFLTGDKQIQTFYPSDENLYDVC